MRLKAKFLGLEAGGKSIVVLNKEDADDLGVPPLGRVKISFKGREVTAIINTTSLLIHVGVIGLYEEVRRALKVEEGDLLEVEIAPSPTSVHFIRNKLRGRKLTYEEVLEIVRDTVKGNLSEIEIAAFVTALHSFGLDLDEATSLSIAMVETGNTLKLDRHPILDKHSIGGVPGDKTTLLVVPIIAACGLTIPKTSSRAITSPLLLPSIMSKKKAVGADLLVVDIPCGRGTKVKTIGEADLLAKDFIELGRRLGIKVQCAVTYGEQPVGYAVGPALEAREALSVLMGEAEAPDLADKATDIAGILLNMSGMRNGKELAVDALRSGRAERKLREIIEAQGGDPTVNPSDIKVGDRRFTFRSERNGYVLWIDNSYLVEIARLAGAPKDKGAGVLLHKKIGDRVKEGEPLFTVYAEKAVKLQRALSMLEERTFMGTGKRMEMLIHEVRERPVTKRAFMLER
ncbi:thymidine phosphorylase [Candidatus Bathyarchaeota archaeon ex4484_40]|nr:MAG: thymidine phosphorylase [Candidatus Bathyarchaeota archaeon ex4484_40]